MTAAGFYVDVGDGGGDAQHDPSGHAAMYTLSTTYNFTKRTFLYGTVAYVDNSKTANFSLLANPREGTGSTSPLQGESQTGAYLGIMHLFHVQQAVRTALPTPLVVSSLPGCG
jgi:predicted porin